MATLPISPHGGRAPVHVPVLDMEPAFRRSVAGMVNDMFLSTADSVPPANDVSREPNPAAPAPVAAAATAILPAAPAARPAPALTSAADFYRADYPLPARPDAPFRSGAIAYSAEPPRLPAFGLLPVLEVFEGESTRAARKRRRVHTLRQGQAVSGWRRWKTWGPHQYKAIAAGIILIAVLWGVGPSGMAAALTNPDWLRVVLASRATMEMRENFHSGMQAWAGGSGNWAATWTHDREGFVRPGQLALFRPSMSQANYRFEFLAQIERKGVGWAVRAGDVRNYYAVKLEVTKPGPRPLMSLVRYPVLRGMRGKAVEIPVSASLQSDTPYRVTMDVSGHRFTASIEGQEVDTWSSDLLASGGVGLFTEAGERARLHWLQVTSNDDLIGRICAFLAGSGETAQARNRQMDQPGLASLSFTPGMRTFHVAEILRTNP